MLRSVIRQLTPSPLPAQTRALQGRHSRPGSQPTVNELIELLNCTLTILKGNVYIVFDALDECAHEERQGQRGLLLNCIKALVSTNTNLHLLVTSRPEPDISILLDDIATHSLNIDNHIEADIGQYVNAALTKPEMATWCEPVKDKIKAKLLSFQERQVRPRNKWKKGILLIL